MPTPSPGRVLVVTAGEKVMLASCGWGPGRLLNVWCTGQSPTTKNYLAPNVNRADGEKPLSHGKR